MDRRNGPHAKRFTPGEVEGRLASGPRFGNKWEAAALTGFNADYLTKLARKGKIPAQKFGNKWGFDLKAIVEMYSLGIPKDEWEVNENAHSKTE